MHLRGRRQGLLSPLCLCLRPGLVWLQAEAALRARERELEKAARTIDALKAEMHELNAK